MQEKGCIIIFKFILCSHSFRGVKNKACVSFLTSHTSAWLTGLHPWAFYWRRMLEWVLSYDITPTKKLFLTQWWEFLRLMEEQATLLICIQPVHRTLGKLRLHVKSIYMLTEQMNSSSLFSPFLFKSWEVTPFSRVFKNSIPWNSFNIISKARPPSL